MNKKTTLLIAAALIILAVGLAWTGLTIPSEPAESPEEPRAMEYQSNFLSEEKNGRVIWDLRSESTTVDMATQATVFKNPIAHYYREDGTVLTLTAPDGTYASDTKNVKLFGGVKATVTDGSALTSNALEWVAGEDRLVATGKAVLSRPGIEARGDKIEAQEAFTVFRAEGNAYIKKEN